MQLFEELVPSFAFLDAATEKRRKEIHLVTRFFTLLFSKKSDKEKPLHVSVLSKKETKIYNEKSPSCIFKIQSNGERSFYF